MGHREGEGLEILTLRRIKGQLLRRGKEGNIHPIEAALLNRISPREIQMKTDTDLIATRIATLPITAAARREALGHVASGEKIAQAFIAIANWLDASPSLKPSYQD
jgi:hypothetical protein